MKKILLSITLLAAMVMGLSASEFEDNKKACDGSGDLDGCIILGLMYEYGEGVRQAKELYGKACDAGIAAGCNAYARLNTK